MLPKEYIYNVKSRSIIRYYIGLAARFYLNVKFSFFRRVARLRGAAIGENTIITWRIARMANKNLIIGDDCAIEADYIDLRGSKIIIHDHVIINREVSIIRVSHYIDDDDKFTTRYFQDLHIGSFSWIATGSKILPQVTRIGCGVVCGAYSVISRDCLDDGIYAGNPAHYIRNHNTRFTNVVVSSLSGGDYNLYKKARKCQV